MLNGIQEKGLNENTGINIKIRKYPGASSTDILDPIKAKFKKRTRSNRNSCSNKTTYQTTIII